MKKNPDIIKIIYNPKSVVFDGKLQNIQMIDELEEARINSGLSKKEFAKLFDSLKPKLDKAFEDWILYYETKIKL